ncbi:UDP-3-O-[3-hydroxymyristoyl] N-acetylglucosamine deacetylase [Deltaproteobacteria bacterium Smac51]|nr:UDP-3-O-[3-hydroxymyristoyl] N-acetylglucosamine deacetylase [Deltaproteobacteria bacterium Smac51]
MIRTQKTIYNSISAESKGLHSGRNITVTLKPAPANSGIIFHRIDLPGAEALLASVENVQSTQLATTLGEGENRISTVEHLMAALVSLGIDNVLVECSGPELPVFDGSAEPWVELINQAGLRDLGLPRRVYLVTRPFRITDGDKSIEVLPASCFSIEAIIDFNGAIGRQGLCYVDGDQSFVKEISRARTFCYLKDVEFMHSKGLALGGGLENAVVVGDDGILNPEGLRYDDEFVRHKVLDFIGDLGMAGAPIIGRFIITKPGHELNRRFVAEALAEPGLLKPATVSAEGFISKDSVRPSLRPSISVDEGRWAPATA